MEIKAEAVAKVLEANGINTIYHANSVITACQFLRSGCLRSRGNIERSGLYQTLQSSDEIDKRHSVWFDVFTDSVDIHHRANRANAYGPVLFEIDVRLITESYVGNLCITKKNPTKWDGAKHEQRWFTSETDLKANFQKGSFDQMIVFRHIGGELPFSGRLKKIVLDDPGKKTPGGFEFFSMAYGALSFAAAEGSLDVKIARRNCKAGCSCVSNYKQDVTRTKELFFPKPT
jgi:hypothetical protein